MKILRSLLVAMVAIVAAVIVNYIYSVIEFMIFGDQMQFPRWLPVIVTMAVMQVLPFAAACGVAGLITGTLLSPKLRNATTALVFVVISALRVWFWYGFAWEAYLVLAFVLGTGAVAAFGVAQQIGKLRTRSAAA